MKKYAYDAGEMIPPRYVEHWVRTDDLHLWSSAFLTLRRLQPATAARQICAMGAACTSGQ
jgi:hypothetical protein